MLNRRTVLRTAALGAIAMPYVAREGFAQAPAHTLKLTFADTRNHPLYQVLLRFADNVKKKTSGAVEVQVYGTGELGSQLNILTGLQTGIIDLCAHTSGYIDTLIPQFQVMDLPFLFPDYAGIRPKLTGPGEPAADFLIEGPAEHGLPQLVHLFGIESPGLTSALSLAEEVLDKLALA